MAGVIRGLFFVGAVAASAAVLLAFVPDATTLCSTGERIAAHLHVMATFDAHPDGPCLFVQRMHPLPEIVAVRSVRTLGLVGSALAGAALLGLPLGFFAARHPHHRWAHAALHGLRLVSSLPVLVWGVGAILVSVTWLGWLPFLGAETSPAHGLWTLLVPVVVLVIGDGTVADLAQGAEAEARRASRQPHLQALRAAGLPTTPHVHYALLGPLGAILASRLTYLLGLSAVVEVLFGWQGLGWQLVESLTTPAKDVPLILALTVVLVGVAYGSHRVADARWLRARALRATLPPTAVAA